MIRVAVDVSALARNRFGGISRVCHATANELSNYDDVRVTAYWYRGEQPSLVPNVQIKQLGLVDRLFQPTADIAHSLCHRLLPVRSRCRVYSTHDAWSLHVNPYQSPEFQRKLGKRLRHDMKKADVVVTGSEWTKSELVRLDAVTADCCVVIADGVDIPRETPESDILNRLRLRRQEYLLFVGRLEYRKNLPHIVSAVNSQTQLKLVCVGEPGYGYEETVSPALSTLASDRLTLISHVAENDLHVLYVNALAAIQPSWDEGFGLPVLEAMAHGCPVITSNQGATREIGEGASILVEPASSRQSAEAIEQLIEDKLFRENMISRGRARAQEYTWDKHGKQLVQLYRNLIS